MKQQIEEAAKTLFNKLKSAGHFKNCNGSWELEQITLALSLPSNTSLGELKTRFDNLMEDVWQRPELDHEDVWRMLLPHLQTKPADEFIANLQPSSSVTPKEEWKCSTCGETNTDFCLCI